MTENLYKPDESVTEERQPAYCPFCGHDGAFDAQGKHYEDVTVRRRSSEKTYRQEWYQHHCSECNGHFQMLTDAWKVEE